MNTNTSASSPPASPASPYRPSPTPPPSVAPGRRAAGQGHQAADGVWVIATKHRPGFNRHMFEINNRTVVFRLRDQSLGRPVLLVANGTDPAQAVSEVRRSPP